MKPLLLLAALLLPASALAAPRCDKLPKRVEREQAAIRPVQRMIVKAPRQLYFHRVPDRGCVTQVFVLRDEALTAYNEWKGWYSVQHTSDKGEMTSGWVKGSGLKAAGAMGLDARARIAPTPAIPAPGLPPEAAAVVERVTMCTHFAGEFNGDASAQDRRVNASMAELRCDSLEADVAALRRKHAGDPAVLKALADAVQP
jgi:hypothetical protein